MLFKNSVKKSGYKCASAMPDGKTGYIIRCDFYSPDPPNIIEENYRQQNNFIKEINLPKCNKIIVSNNKDMAVYSKKRFGMFDGEEIEVELLCDNDMANVIIDQFGRDVTLRKIDDEHFKVNVDVVLSSQFLSWIFACVLLSMAFIAY